MSERLPEGWTENKIAEMGKLSTSSVDKKISEKEVPIRLLNYMDVYRNNFIDSRISFQTVTATSSEIERFSIEAGDVFFTPSSETPSDIGHSAVVTESVDDVLQSYHLVRLRLFAESDTDRAFRGYLFQSEECMQAFRIRATGSTRFTLSLADFSEVTVKYPISVFEQKKIAAILTSVDDVIEKTEAQIRKLEDLKKATMNELLTKGIGHTEFKDSPVGRIPKSWEVRHYSELVEKYMPEVKLVDRETYSPLIVRRRHDGVEVRETKLGSKILVKKQFEAVPGCFVISKRQIFHGSCGMIHDRLPGNTIISKEYLQLRSKTDALDIRYLDLFSFHPEFHEQIKRTTYGVDVEKFVFKDEWWFKEAIPIPPVEEQQAILGTVASIQKTLNETRIKGHRLSQLKSALMQDLLSGKVRVPLN